MGIRGLTTFVQNNSYRCFEPYELHDCNVVIDGLSIACQLYKNHCKSNDCFGGDYDKFANTIYNFFRTLKECNIKPYIVFDGGYEKRKIRTVMDRTKDKICSAGYSCPVSEGAVSVFPLFLSCTFMEIAIELNLNIVQCEFEGDTETASIAKILDCPVLSFDSDFYIFDVMYVPFPTLDLTVRKGKAGGSYKCLYCQIYRIDKFVASYSGLDKSTLPLLAVLLGNDYVKKKLFAPFFRNLKMHGCSGTQNAQQRTIRSLIIWLQNETMESAIRNVLVRFKKRRRKLVAQRIQDAMKGYYLVSSDLLETLGISARKTDVDSIDVDKIEQSIKDDGGDDISSGSDSEDEAVFTDEVPQSKLTKLFLDKFRKCLYPASFMNMLLQNLFLCSPQVEDNSQEQAHAINFTILSAVHKILSGPGKQLTCIGRIGERNIKYFKVPVYDKPLPSLEEIQDMGEWDRKLLVLGILDIEGSFLEILDHFPEKWHLFVISLKYSFQKSIITIELTYSLIMCFIILNYVDKQVGFCRSGKMFEKKFGNKLMNNFVPDSLPRSSKLCDVLKCISCEESVVCLHKLIAYFQIDLKLRSNHSLFDRGLVHNMSQYQSSLLFIKCLNNLFNFPFPNVLPSNVFNGTFIYNFTVNLRKRTNLTEYIDIILKDVPTSLYALTSVIERLNFSQTSSSETNKCRKRRKNKKQKNAAIINEAIAITENISDTECSLDPNNIFSILSRI